MEWYTGPIPEAINASKQQNKLFVVFIFDSSEASGSTQGAIDSCCSLLQQNAVAIKLEQGTEGAGQFAQIYPISVTPSIYFINPLTGVPVEIMTQDFSSDTFAEKLSLIVEKFKPAASQDAQTAIPSSSSSADVSTGASGELQMECDGDVCRVVTKSQDAAPAAEDKSSAVSANKTDSETPPESEPAQDTSSTAGSSEDAMNTSENSAGVSLEERIARAKVLAQQKQLIREQEKKEQELNDEIQRREVGKKMKEIKREQEEKEMKDIASERKKAKIEDKLARERVKAQIAADRADREARAALFRGEVKPASPSASSIPSAPAPSDGMCRLKLRLPDGSSSIAKFSVSAPLSEVHQHVVDNVPRPFSQFKLASSVLQRPFTPEDMDRTLTELQLVPSAIIVIMPTGTGSGGNRGSEVSSSTGGGFADTIMWLILTPINTVISFIRSFLFGGPPAPQNSNRRLSDTEASGGVRRRTDRPKTAYGSRTDARHRREGNIHRLGQDDNADNSEDDNNTWNGNSTQQM